MPRADEPQRLRVYVEEDGCDRRRLDVLRLRRYLEANDYVVVKDPAHADKILVATCAFKKREEDASVQRLRSLCKHGVDVIVYGCLPDIAAERYEEFGDLPFVSPREIESIQEHFGAPVIAFSDVAEPHVMEGKPLDIHRALRFLGAGLPQRDELVQRARVMGPNRLKRMFVRGAAPYYLFVSRGCLGHCSYCAIRRPIGRVSSKPIDTVVAEFRQGLAEGHTRFVVLGDDPGCYGLDLGTSLPELLAALFEASTSPVSTEPRTDVPAVRFTIREIHPKYLVRYGRDLLDLPGFSQLDEILCPVQSGSDRVLALMEREHSAKELAGIVSRISLGYPRLRLSTQIIVGFPQETEAEFIETLQFVKAVGFDSVVVFPYHDKEGTTSSRLDGKVPDEEIRRRMRMAFDYFRRVGVDAYYSCP